MRRQFLPAVLLVLVFAVLAGIAFPLAITALSQALFPFQAGGSLLTRDGRVVGSALIGQGFARPGYFHPRPSAAGAGYDAAASSGSNLGPTSRKLILGIHNKLPSGADDPANFDGVADLAQAYRAENLLPPETILPADAVTRSGSGLDPHISPVNARLQAARVARARGLALETVRALVESHVEGRQLGFLGEARVNVLQLNLALDQEAHSATQGSR